MPTLTTKNISLPQVKSSSQNVKLRNEQNIGSGKSVTLKNQITEFTSLDDIGDVDESLKVDGAVPVWNETTNKYEIRTIEISDSDLDLDGGLF